MEQSVKMPVAFIKVQPVGFEKKAFVNIVMLDPLFELVFHAHEKPS